MCSNTHIHTSQIHSRYINALLCLCVVRGTWICARDDDVSASLFIHFRNQFDFCAGEWVKMEKWRVTLTPLSSTHPCSPHPSPVIIDIRHRTLHSVQSDGLFVCCCFFFSIWCDWQTDVVCCTQYTYSFSYSNGMRSLVWDRKFSPFISALISVRDRDVDPIGHPTSSYSTEPIAPSPSTFDENPCVTRS